MRSHWYKANIVNVYQKFVWIDWIYVTTPRWIVLSGYVLKSAPNDRVSCCISTLANLKNPSNSMTILSMIMGGIVNITTTPSANLSTALMNTMTNINTICGNKSSVAQARTLDRSFCLVYKLINEHWNKIVIIMLVTSALFLMLIFYLGLGKMIGWSIDLTHTRTHTHTHT